MLGVGLGLRQEIYEPTLAHAAELDWLEIVPENYMGRGGLLPAAEHDLNIRIKEEALLRHHHDLGYL